jgi:hypothetical protein
VPASISLNVNERARDVYERLAKDAGLNILFGRALPPTNARLTLKDVGFFDALDLLAMTTGTFWQPLNENTILVLEETEPNRRNLDLQTVETLYVPAGFTVARLNELMTTLRTVLGLRGIYQSHSAGAIVIRDIPARIELVESLIPDMSGAPLRKRIATDLRAASSETGINVHTAASDRDRLQIRTKDPITFSSVAGSKEAFEKLAAVAGLQVLFGRNFPDRPVDFNIQKVDVIEALDFLALQSGNFWQPLDARTILVLEDTPQTRRDFAEHLVKTIYLPRETSTNGLNEIMNVLRTALSARGVYQADPTKAILIHDTPQRVALVENLVDHLNPLPMPAKSVQIFAPHYAETGLLGIAAAVRSDLAVSVARPISINVTADSQSIYEVLADMAGIKVRFSRDFYPIRQAFRLEGVDILDAIDYFSLVTQNAWKVVDQQTILVFPDTVQNRRDLETQITKTFYIGYKPTTNSVNTILNVLRTAMSIRNAQSGDGFVTVQETPQRMMVVEKVVESLDRQPLAPENPLTGSVKVVLSSYRDNVEIRRQSQSLDIEVGADRATLRSGSTIPVSNGVQTFTQQVGFQIDSEVRSAEAGRYRVLITITTREVYDNPAWPVPQTTPPITSFRNFVFAGPLLLENGETAQLSGTDPTTNQRWRADVTLTLKK